MTPCESSSTERMINRVAMDKTAPVQGDGPIRKTAQGVCKNVVHEDVCISAQVVIDPIVEIGPITTHCMSRPEIGPCKGKCEPCGSCSFVVRQRICVEVPITFGATTTADPLGIVCNGADAGPCKCGC